MEKKVKLKKIELKKEVVSTLSDEQLREVDGGWTTSFGQCTQGWTAACCNSTNTGFNCTITGEYC